MRIAVSPKLAVIFPQLPVAGQGPEAYYDLTFALSEEQGDRWLFHKNRHYRPFFVLTPEDAIRNYENLQAFIKGEADVAS